MLLDQSAYCALNCLWRLSECPDERTPHSLEKAAEGYARMMSGKAEFRVVLTMSPPALGVFGMAGCTAYSGLRVIGQRAKWIAADFRRIYI